MKFPQNRCCAGGASGNHGKAVGGEEAKSEYLPKARLTAWRRPLRERGVCSPDFWLFRRGYGIFVLSLKCCRGGLFYLKGE